MNTADFIPLIEFNNWANARLLEIAARLPQEQLFADASLSFGSPFYTLRHMLDAEWSWRLTCQNEPVTGMLWEQVAIEDLAALNAHWRAEGERLLAFVRALAPDADDLQRKPTWMDQSAAIHDILFHVVNHASGHRSELGWYFTRLGHSPGDLEYIDYRMGLLT